VKKEERRSRVQDLFLAALDIRSEEREAYLERECGTDVDLSNEVRELVASAEAEPGLLSTSAASDHEAWLSEDGSPPPASDPDPERIGPYRVVRRLGEGGMGVVYLAEQTAPLERLVAVKVLKLGMDTREFAARFDTERKALARMSHSGIARVYDAGVTEEGQPFLAMEHIDGEPVTAYCDRRGLDLSSRLEIFLQVCDAVQHAHQNAIIHRDLKPTNILVHQENKRAAVKVIDFGIAKATDVEHGERTAFTRFGRLLGTLEYMSPEQTLFDEAAAVDTRTDVYSLGVVLYELLVGALPFAPAELRGRGFDGVLRTIRETDAPRPTTRLKRLSPEERTDIARRRRLTADSLSRQLRGDLEWVLARTLEKDPARRYPTASELAADVRHYLAHKPVEAAPPGVAYRLSRFARRHRSAVAAATLVVVGLSLSLCIAVHEYRKADHLRGRAEEALEGREAALADRDAALAREITARRRSEGLRLTAESRAIAASEPELALLLALEGARLHPGRQANDALLEALRGYIPLVELAPPPEGGKLVRASFSPNGQLVATVGEDLTTRVWNAGNGALVRSLDGSGYRPAFSADSRLLATNTGGRSLSVWDVVSGERLRELPNTGYVYSTRFDRTSKRLLAALRNGDAAIWDLEDGRLAVRFDGHRDRVYTALFDPQEERVVTASRDGTAVIWDAASGRRLHRFDCGVQVNEARFDPTGRHVGAVSLNGRLRVWNAETGELLFERFVGGGELYMLSFSSGGDLVAAASQGRTALVWSLPDGAEVLKVTGHREPVTVAALDGGGGTLLTASTDKTARLWELPSGAQRAALLGHREQIHWAEFDAAGERAVTASLDGTARVWRLEPVLESLALRGHSSRVYCAAFSPDGSRLVTGSRDGTARVWDAVSRRETGVYRGHSERIYEAKVLPDGTRCVTTSSDRTARIWDLRTTETLSVLAGHSALVIALDVSPDGSLVATGSEDGTARIWSSGGESRATLPHRGRVDDLAFSPDGTLLATAAWDRAVRLWKAATGDLVRQLDGHDAEVMAVRFAAGGRLVSVSRDRTARVWSPATGECEAVLEGHGDRVVALAVSRDGGRAATASDDESVALWNLGTGRLERTLRGHEGPVRGVDFDPLGELLASGSIDGTVRLWSAATGECLATFRGHENHVLSVGFDPAGRWVISTSEDGSARLWPVDIVAFAAGHRPRELTPPERRELEIVEEVGAGSGAGSEARAR
jgi:WD40 repeat protein/serine/threonine protein kinase